MFGCVLGKKECVLGCLSVFGCVLGVEECVLGVEECV